MKFHIKGEKMSMVNQLTLRFCFYIFRFFGLAPFTYTISILNLKKPDTDVVMTFCCSYCGAFCNFLWICSVLATSYAYLVPACVEERPDRSMLSKSVGIVLAFGGNIAVVFLFLKYAFQQKKIVNFANRLVRIDTALQRLRGIYSLDHGSLKIMAMILIQLLLNVLVLISEVFFSGNSISSTITYVCHSTIFCFQMMQYAVVVTLIEKRLVSLNEALGKIGSNSDSTKTFVLSSNERLLNRSIMVEITIVKRAYIILCDLCAEVADFYATLTTYIVVHFSTAIIYNLYFIIAVPATRVTTRQTIIDYCNSSLWVISTATSLSVLAICATRACKEMKSTSQVVHNLLVSGSNSREFRKELKNFSLDLLHRNFQFTAYDMFSLDTRLLSSIFSTIATYLVIFLQFQLSSYKEHYNNSTNASLYV